MEAKSIISSLQSVLDSLASQRDLNSTPDFSGLESMANRSRTLTLESLQQLSGALIRPPTRSALPSSLTATSSGSISFSRTSLNMHKMCKNARLYRMNREDFSQLATAVPNTNEAVWKCNHCTMIVAQATLKLSAGSEDRIWIAPVGFFKAHCEHRSGSAEGWTCIWPVVAPPCYSRFDSEKRLLEHMRDFHVVLGGQGRDSAIQWSADFHYGDAETCGFGALIGGQRMRNSEGSFIVPAG